MPVLIKFKNLTKRFKKRIILTNINLEINKGEIFGIIGMSGSGKTTLLKILIGFLEPEAGDILFYSEKDSCYKSIYRSQLEIRNLFGFATQRPSFYPKLTVEENLLHFGALYHLPKKIAKTNASHLLELTGLLDAKDLLAQNLSGGMQKKLSIACSLIHKPKILILDEPTADLDPLSRKETWQIIKGIHRIGTTVLIASHFLDELEEVCNRLAILYDKRIIATGTPDQLKTQYFKNQEIHLIASPGNYNAIAKALSKYPSLAIKNILVKDHKLIIYTPKAESTLHQILHIIARMDEKLINITLTKPSLAAIFESLKKR